MLKLIPIGTVVQTGIRARAVPKVADDDSSRVDDLQSLAPRAFMPPEALVRESVPGNDIRHDALGPRDQTPASAA